MCLLDIIVVIIVGSLTGVVYGILYHSGRIDRFADMLYNFIFKEKK